LDFRRKSINTEELSKIEKSELSDRDVPANRISNLMRCWSPQINLAPARTISLNSDPK
jgi:hypothetical protein